VAVILHTFIDMYMTDTFFILLLEEHHLSLLNGRICSEEFSVSVVYTKKLVAEITGHLNEQWPKWPGCISHALSGWQLIG
jgi:hypothetical protein